ncbi:MAG: 50S ribosomal protein L17 [Bacteroidales bacterium]|nr:50S ribosomal protein L17 [Bacteroidales bacterium]MCF8343330.1 50S ribosomal protein L17 [Bacteroidales bacterium]MCF8350213.1 50S ribosomal protein L17 [Bacteroidales bacterium]MCF8375018.1 50S ribosomal protein L17 [Bacteroidales bacterium]MCF8401659.1 50S ribosomal protein L17 [Bacteroidales bacterium]
MRHLKKNNHLSRTRAHRRAMLANMASSLIIHKRIHTTVAKAKALRRYVEPLITRSKDDSTHSRRVVFSYLQSKEALNELFREVSPKVFERPGGYTRIIKIGNRLGDNAEMCMIELVDYNENLLAEAEDRKSKSARRGGRRRSGKKKSTEKAPAAREETKVQKPPKESQGQEEPKAEAGAEAEVKEEPQAEKTEEKTAEKKEEKSAEKKEEQPETKAAEKKKEEKEEEKKDEKSDQDKDNK